ncbi:hypothetical protein [Lysinibacillus sp. FSL W8-0953]|uniref:hypothetical protein n=1 Tax=Lysinibacillus sp. FSL W8-0953 TaxID=2954640 RepID=UPI0030FB2705
MNVIIFPGALNQERLKSSTMVKKETDNSSSLKLLSQAFKALNTYKVNNFNK